LKNKKTVNFCRGELENSSPKKIGGNFLVEKTLVLKLSDDADIVTELEKLAKENSVEYGMLLSGCGKIKEFELISHEQKGGVGRTKFEKEFEVNAISGKIQIHKSGKIDSNIRISVTSTGFTPKAGQLVKGKAAGQLEIGIRKIDFKKIIEA